MKQCNAVFRGGGLKRETDPVVFHASALFYIAMKLS